MQTEGSKSKILFIKTKKPSYIQAEGLRLAEEAKKDQYLVPNPRKTK